MLIFLFQLQKATQYKSIINRYLKSYVSKRMSSQKQMKLLKHFKTILCWFYFFLRELVEEKTEDADIKFSVSVNKW